METAARLDKTKRAVAVMGPLFPSEKQWRKLGLEIGTMNRAQMQGFVRYANGYDHAKYITMGMVARAINLATKGVNEFGTLEELLEFGSDPDALPTPKNYIEIRYKARRLEPCLDAFDWSSDFAPRSGSTARVAASPQTSGALEALHKRRLAIAALTVDPKDHE